MHKLFRLLVALVLVIASLVMFLGIISPLPIWAASYTINSSADPGDGTCNVTECTLREAISVANTSAGVPDTINFSITGVITLSSSAGALPTLSDNAGVTVNGDIDGDGNPDVAINGVNVSSTNASGIRIQSSNNIISGLAIYGFPGFGITITGTNSINNQILSNTIGLDLSGVAIGNGRDILNNGDGIIIRNGANNNTVRGNTIGSNLRHGVSLSAASANTVTLNFIGLTSNGLDRGNGEDGVMLKDGASNHLVQDNQIKYNNRYGIYFYGLTAPPHDNQIIDNIIANNDSLTVTAKAAIVLQRTHRNDDSSVPVTGDNLIQSNQIISNAGMGIYNLGASPLITGNIISDNASYGIFNAVDFGASSSPASAGDDILSMPGIYGNSINSNGKEGIRSVDSAPLNRYTLAADNTIGDNDGAYDIHQIWYGAVEVLAGGTTISSGLNITLNSQSTGQVLANTYAAADAVQGIWAKGGTSYNDVTSWIAIDEYVVQNNGTLLEYSPYTITVSGAYSGSVLFSFDAISATHPVSPMDYNLPFGRMSGVIDVPAHTLHRYQIAEVNYGQDSDSDGIPDPTEMPCTPGVGCGYPPGCDSDSDGVPDYWDTDSDNDGIGDNIEGSEDSSSDVDAVPNYRDTDSDGDDIEDWREAGCAIQPTGGVACPDPSRDSDGDTLPDWLDNDSDADGIKDANEYYARSSDTPLCANTTLDSDGDTIPNCRDNNVDSDNMDNYRDLDSDGDGATDSQESKINPEPAPFGHEGVPAWLDPVRGLYLPVILR
ncbi:MAG: hypothetical protein BroJett011_59450 [Chloroflexota bacterium]|nr:MAG: hypothetical protein BroJett011_59450 [Chloroflexota bacterium]